MTRRALALLVAFAAAAVPAAAQDSVPQPGGVRLTLRYDPGNRPSLVIVPGAGHDAEHLSARSADAISPTASHHMHLGRYE